MQSDGKLWEAQRGVPPTIVRTEEDMDQVFSHRNIEEKHLAVKKVFVAFVDLKKALIELSERNFWSISECGINGGLLRAVLSMYENWTACVSISIKIGLCLKQRRMLSVRLFSTNLLHTSESSDLKEDF